MTHAMHRDPAADHQCRIGNSTVEFGRFTYGIERASVIQWGEGSALRIGSFCSLAADITFILGGNHRSEWATTYPFGHIHIEHLRGREIKGHPATNGDIVIGHDVWIATGATIMSGITVGDGAIIAANAHVVKNIGPYEIWGGKPRPEDPGPFHTARHGEAACSAMVGTPAGTHPPHSTNSVASTDG